MSEDSRDTRNAMESDQLTEVDGLCDQFENEWKSGERPRLDEYLENVKPTHQSMLIRELLPVELAYRRRIGERPTRTEYRKRFPQHATVVDSVFRHAETITLRPGQDLSWGDVNRPEWMDESLEGGLGDCPHAGYANMIQSAHPFDSLRPNITRAVLQDVHLQEYSDNDAILVQGNHADHLIIVVEGAAEVRVHGDLKEHLVAQVGPATVLGEISLLTNEPCTANVIATGPVRALLLPAESFHQLLTRYPILRTILMKLISERLGAKPLDALTNKVAGNYHILRCVGRGGMGVVYEAERRDTGQKFALKMMSHRLIYDDHGFTRFSLEERIGRSLRHPNLIRVYDSFEAFGSYFLAIDLCVGTRLDDLIDEIGAFPTQAVRAIVGQLAEVLSYIHGCHIIHRDVKPGNVMVCDDGRLKLIDFGLAKSENATKNTQAGAILGTPPYMAPEQLMGEKVDYRTDIYALGCITYELLTGRPLFRRSDTPDVKLEFTLPPANAIRNSLAPDIYDLLEQTLAPYPNQRTLDLDQFSAWSDSVTPDSLRATFQ